MRSAARNKISLMTVGQASASTQIFILSPEAPDARDEVLQSFGDAGAMKKLKQEAFFSGEGRYPERRVVDYCNTSNDPFRHESGLKKRPPERGGLGSMTPFLSSVSAPRKTRIVEFPLKGSSCSSPRLMQ